MVPKVPAPPSGTTRGDVLHSATKAIAGMVPFAGGAISEAFDKAVAAPADKRLARWLEMVATTINDLVNHVEGLTPEKLAENEAFLTTVISTTQSAMLTEREEKLRILQAVIQRTGSGMVLDEFMRNTFLSVIDRYTPEHVWLLRTLSNPSELREGFQHLQQASPDAVSSAGGEGEHAQIEKLVPYLLKNTSRDIATELFSDLHRDRFCHGSEGFAHTFHPDKDQSIVTIRGQEFLRFLINPDYSSRRSFVMAAVA